MADGWPVVVLGDGTSEGSSLRSACEDQTGSPFRCSVPAFPIPDLRGTVLGRKEMTDRQPLEHVLAGWQLPKGDDLLACVERMIRPALLAGHFGSSHTRLVSGLQYHLGGAQDTEELADLARLSSSDRVLDVCCFIGGPALQLAHRIGCRVTGIDLDENAIAAAERLAEVAGLSDLLDFRVADAGDLPFEDSAFSVVWNQGSLDPNEHWLEEFDRVLSPGGRFAFTFQMKGTKDDGRWTLEDLILLVERLGYRADHAEDITQRDIRIGWKALDSKLSEREEEFREILGPDWVQDAHEEFRGEAEAMRHGTWGNGRIVATKQSGQ
jgi:SAM-dependent methyltransferase